MSLVTKKEKMLLGRGKSKLISVILPSRKRFGLLLKSLESLYSKAKDPSRIEAIIRFDKDDISSISKISELPFGKIDLSVIVGNRMRGYIDLNKYINECCSVSTGDFLFLFNDDSTVITDNWDLEIEKYSGQTVVLNPDTDDDAQQFNTFPIISRDIFDTVGHFSLQAHNDTWVSEVGKMLGIQKHLSIKIFHDRPDNEVYTGTTDEREDDDITWKERTEIFPTSNQEFWGPKFTALRREDAVKIYNEIINKENK